MPQNPTKSSSKTPSKSSSKTQKKTHSTHQRTKAQASRNRVFKPKNAKVVAQEKQVKKSVSGMTGQLEKMLAKRAGYTEMVGGDGEGGARGGARIGRQGEKGGKALGKGKK